MHALDQAWDTLKRDFDAACSQVARAARCQITHELNQGLRRLLHYRTEGEWTLALLDAASRFVQQVAVFTLENGVLKLRGQCKLNLPEHFSFPAGSAGAFSSAIETKDPIIAVRTSSEVTNELSLPDAAERAHIFPIVNGTRVVAVIFAADRDYVDVNALELVACVASAVLERRSNTTLHAQIASPGKTVPPESEAAGNTSNGAAPAQSTADGRVRHLPSWADLSEEQRNVHVRAQRFSRVTVAEMQLSRPEACRAGREQGNLYLFLKNEIDRARETYRKEFMTIPSMVDYLHLELVGTAAEGNEVKLGADYPGQLV